MAVGSCLELPIGPSYNINYKNKIITQVLHGKTKAYQEHSDKDARDSYMCQQCGVAANLQQDHRLIP